MAKENKPIAENEIRSLFDEGGKVGFALVENAYDILSKNEIAPENELKLFFELVERADFECTIENSSLSAEKLEDLEYDYESYVNGFLDTLTRMNYSPEEFYRRVWTFIDSDTFRTQQAKSYALFVMCADARIPYYNCTNSLRLSKEEYKEVCDKLSNEIIKARSIIVTKQRLRSEEASALVDLLDSLEGRVEKSVLLSIIIRMVEIRTKTNSGNTND